MNVDRLRRAMADLADEVPPVELRDRVLAGSRQLALRRVASASVAAVALGAVTAVTAYVLTPRTGDDAPPITPATTDASPSVMARLSDEQVRVVDPESPRDWESAGIEKVVDGDERTGWRTHKYRTDPRFGGLKRGIGILLDMRDAGPVSSVTVIFSDPGVSARLLAGDQDPGATKTGDEKIIRTFQTGVGLTYQRHDDRTMRFDAPPTGERHRFLLLWITELPAIAADTYPYQVGVQEILVART
jgi:hypothetical protein